MDWSFLLPWANDLARVVVYEQREEVEYGTLHDRVDFVALQLAELDVFVDAQTHDERWEELTCLREGLELLALAIHYDKSAWPFFHDHCFHNNHSDGGGSWFASTFPLDLDDPAVQAKWQLCFHDSLRDRSDSKHALRAGIDMLTRMPTDILGVEYHKAKRRIRELVGAAWDDAYRVPVSLSFDSPEIDQNPTRWLSVVYELVRSLNDPAGATGDSFCLGPIMLSLQRLPMMDFTDELLRNVMNAYAYVPRLALALQFSDTVSVAPTINDAVGISSVTTQLDDRFVGTLVLHGSSGTPQFAGWCSSVARAQRLGCLSLRNAFTDQTQEERALQWRWLAYALSNRYWINSVRHLRLEEEALTRDDVEQFTAKHYSTSDKNPPSRAIDKSPRTVRLAAQSLICLPGGETEPMERLGFTQAYEFLVLDNDCESEWMPVLVPGYGRCQVDCASIMDTREIARPGRRGGGGAVTTRLLSLNLHLERCDAEPLPLLLSHFSATLVRVNILLKENVGWDAIQLRTIFRQCHALRFLSLRRVDIGTMDTILDAYRAGQCRLTSLSLWNTWVEAASLTRFAFELADRRALMNLHLKEFRFNYDDLDDAGSLPDDDGIAAFSTMLGYNKTLTFFEIALEPTLFAKYGDRLLALDGAIKVSAIPVTLRMAFLSVVTNAEESRVSAPRKKPRSRGSFAIPSERREAIVNRIWGFVSPVDTVTRTMSVTHIQSDAALSPTSSSD